MSPHGGGRYAKVIDTALFVPTDIAGLQLWFDASDAATITHSGGAVSQWNDKSGNARHAVQATGANQPMTGTRTQNAKNVIDFDGTNDAMLTSSFTWDDPATLFVVCLNDDGADATNQIVIAAQATARLQIQKNAANSWRMTHGNNVNGGTANTAAHVFACMFNGASSELKLDGVTLATGNAGTNVAISTVRRIGQGSGVEYWDGWVAEHLHYDTLLSAGQVETVESYLGTKWGITIT